MGKVIFDTSMSLDGFMTAANQTAEEPMGDGGLRLMEWAMGDDERSSELLEGWVSGLGASIAGRTTYDTSLPWWGADGPVDPPAGRCSSSPTKRRRRALKAGSTRSSPTGSRARSSRPRRRPAKRM